MAAGNQDRPERRGPAGAGRDRPRRRTVWIDLENSPHVLFFLPWIDWLREQGHEVVLTARDQSQTLGLLDLHGLGYTAIGDHGGGGRLGKALRGIRRARSLRRALRRRRIDLAMGHGSRAQAVAAAWMRVPALTFTDYEYVALRVYGLLCREVYFPDSVPREVLRRRGIPLSKLVSYPGFKEQIYIDTETDRPRPVDPPLIVVRPPARQAHYHSPLSEVLYRRLLARLAREVSGARVLFLPRYREDEAELRAFAARFPHCSVPARVLDGRELVQTASLVVSGGGTMVREAAVLGVPAASYFGGPVGGVDRALGEAGRLRLLRTEGDVDGLWLPGTESAPPAAAPHPAAGASGRIPSSRVTREFLRQRVGRWLRDTVGC